MKFGRNYKITIQVTDATAIILKMPLTIEFNIHRSVSASLNGMTLRIFNLSELHRNLIYQDRFDTRRFKIIVEMGYGEDLSTVFIGDIYQAGSSREGQNIITTIDARDGNFDTNQSVVNVTLAKGTTLRQTLEYLAKQFPNLTIGKITNVTPGMQDIFERPVVLEGNVYQLIKLYANLKLTQVYVDLGVINILGQNEIIVNKNLTLISAKTGVLNTPMRDQAFLSVTTLLEPRVLMGQVVQLDSTIIPIYNGLYKVLGVTHKGVISGAVSGQCTTTFQMIGNQLLGGFQTAV